ncbi:MAG: hypothetical protein AseanaTS_12040 [Candidatus Pelagadaptatus aseana]
MGLYPSDLSHLLKVEFLAVQVANLILYKEAYIRSKTAEPKEARILLDSLIKIND